jgi:hypothetical protein
VLGGSQRLGAAAGAATRPHTGGVEFVARATREPVHAAAVGLLERAEERFAGVGAAIGPPQGGTEVDERPRVLEPRR